MPRRYSPERSIEYLGAYFFKWVERYRLEQNILEEIRIPVGSGIVCAILDEREIFRPPLTVPLTDFTRFPASRSNRKILHRITFFVH